ncbi:hypothetical protein Bca52824_078779 [Brassica carinata]|uniref:Neprosin activation peptide domain-containing protein n=1 Tax=Brassica carinata TaxID=52824 RepID=A0A8X7TYG7_BRACI|nr:hypothetical protein Bca52824_078779 [Brassica carinata]
MALISENVTYDCIDIYKQPGLQHPFLKTHKIQKKSSVSRPELKMQTGKNETSNKRKIVCPNDTVPILRNTKEYVTNSQMFAEKHFHPLSADSPGTHVYMETNVFGHLDFGRVRMGKDVTIPHVQGLFKYQR